MTDLTHRSWKMGDLAGPLAAAIDNSFEQTTRGRMIICRSGRLQTGQPIQALPVDDLKQKTS